MYTIKVMDIPTYIYSVADDFNLNPHKLMEVCIKAIANDDWNTAGDLSYPVIELLTNDSPQDERIHTARLEVGAVASRLLLATRVFTDATDTRFNKDVCAYIPIGRTGFILMSERNAPGIINAIRQNITPDKLQVVERIWGHGPIRSLNYLEGKTPADLLRRMYQVMAEMQAAKEEKRYAAVNHTPYGNIKHYEDIIGFTEEPVHTEQILTSIELGVNHLVERLLGCEYTCYVVEGENWYDLTATPVS